MAAADEEIDWTPVMTRQICWDMLPHAEVEDTLREMKMVPGSEEGTHMEHQDSHVRLARLRGYFPLIDRYSDIVAQVYGAYYTNPVTSEDLGVCDEQFDEIRARFDAQNEEIVKLGVVAVLSQLIHTGLVAPRIGV